MTLPNQPHSSRPRAERIPASVAAQPLDSAQCAMRLLLAILLSTLTYVVIAGIAPILGIVPGLFLFIVAPFTVSMAGSYALNRMGVPRGMAGPGFVIGSLLAGLVALNIMRLEGLACIIMSLPILLLCATLGAMTGGRLARAHGLPRATPYISFGVLPLALLVADQTTYEQQADFVTTVIEIDAPADVIWRNVISFPEIPEFGEGDEHPATFMLKYPQPRRCDIDGEGVGAMRYCIFTSGQFDERVTVWKPGEELTFEVDAQPKRIDRSIQVTRGQFRFVPLDNGRVRIEGTTWYRLKLRPAWYWDFWTEPMLHDIHARVLRHVKRLSEGSAGRGK